jgi:hypothetical protein
VAFWRAEAVLEEERIMPLRSEKHVEPVSAIEDVVRAAFA